MNSSRDMGFACGPFFIASCWACCFFRLIVVASTDPEPPGALYLSIGGFTRACGRWFGASMAAGEDGWRRLRNQSRPTTTSGRESGYSNSMRRSEKSKACEEEEEESGV